MKEVIYVGNDPNLVKYLTRLKTYKVMEWNRCTSNDPYKIDSVSRYITVRNDKGQSRRYYASYFSTVQEWRDKQIDKLI
jgi:hypothetical protein